MSAPRTDFAYDEFERYLLSTAKHDCAPPDLPARMGIALGLSVPILVATEMATTFPALTTAASGAQFGSAIAPSGFAASIKACLGFGSTSLFGTAIKGIAIGVLSGTTLIGTGHAVTQMTGRGSANLTATAHSNTAAQSLRMPATRAVEPRAATERTQPTEPASNLVSATRTAVASARVPRTRDETAPLDEKRKPLPRFIGQETTTAIARFAPLFDNVSALYDTPKSSTVPPTSPATVVAPPEDLPPAQLLTLRKATISRTRTLLGQGKAAKALAELDTFHKKVGAKHFGVDELLLRIESLAILGRAKEAQANVAFVERLAPASAALRLAQQLARSRFVR